MRGVVIGTGCLMESGIKKLPRILIQGTSVLFIALMAFCQSWVQGAEFHDIMSDYGPRDPLGSVDLGGLGLTDIQGFALAYSLRDESCDILRGRFSDGLVEVRALKEQGFSLPPPLNVLFAKIIDGDEVLEKKARELGWYQWPVSDRVSMTAAYSYKRKQYRRVCLLRLHHEEFIHVAADFSSEEKPERLASIYNESHIQTLDVFSPSTDRWDTEYILMVTKPPGNHPLVKALEKTLGPDWDIFVQQLPDGRGGLATLSLIRMWAVEQALKSKNPNASGVGLTGGQISAYDHRPIAAANLPQLQAERYETILRVRMDVAEKPFPAVPIDIDGNGPVLVASTFILGDMGNIHKALSATEATQADIKNIRSLTARSVVTRAHEFLKIPEALNQGTDLQKRFLVNLSDLPVEIVDRKRQYPLPNDMTPEAWLALIEKSVWSKEFSKTPVLTGEDRDP